MANLAATLRHSTGLSIKTDKSQLYLDGIVTIDNESSEIIFELSLV